MFRGLHKALLRSYFTRPYTPNTVTFFFQGSPSSLDTSSSIYLFQGFYNLLVNLGTCVYLVKSICATSRPTPSGWHDRRISELSPTLIAALCNHLPVTPPTSRGCQAWSSHPATDELTTSQVRPFCLRPWNCSHLCEPTCGFCMSPTTRPWGHAGTGPSL